MDEPSDTHVTAKAQKQNATFFRFEEDPVNKLILETLKVKPVNSEYYAVLKRLKPGEKYSKREILMTKEDLETAGDRSKHYLAQVGFLYGRFQTQNSDRETSTDKVRIRAPGPVIDTSRHEIPSVAFKDRHVSKPPEGFKKINSDRAKTANRIFKTFSSRPQTKESESQMQARECLQYLKAINPGERKYIKSVVAHKLKTYKNELDKSIPLEIKRLESRGMLSSEANEARVLTMMNVKMRNKMVLNLYPIVRKAKNDVRDHKIKE